MLIIPDRFRWVFDTLHFSTPSSLSRILDELPISLVYTYDRLLQEIPEEKQQSAHRLFRCLVAAMRPLNVYELAEIFAINFDSYPAPKYMVDQRSENPEEAILSTCPSLITITKDEGFKIVQFFPCSVKDFLSSARVQNCEVGSIRYFHISPDAAHTILAQACLAVLLHSGEKMDKGLPATTPLAFYAARHWVDHAHFGNVTSQIQDTMVSLFNPQNSYFAAWTRIYDVDSHWVGPFLQTHPDLRVPSRPQGTALYYAALCGFGGLVNYLISTHAEDVNANCGLCGTPLHAATYMGHLDAVHVLINHGAKLNARNNLGGTPLSLVCHSGSLRVVRMLLESGADADVANNENQTPLHAASTNGHLEAMRMLLDHRASVDARDNADQTPLYVASANGHLKAVTLLLERGANANTQTTSHSTPLHGASESGHLGVVKMLLMHGAEVHGRDGRGWTPLGGAKRNGHEEVAKLLSEHGAEAD